MNAAPMCTSGLPTTDRLRRPPSRGQIAAIVVGNGLEFYDFLIYSFFALQIGETFFPARDSASSLLASLATFGAGFLARPIGAIVLGRLADRVGRKPAMLTSFALMGSAVLGMAVTPGYATLGPAASVLVILYRLIQGFAVGGEVGSSTAFLLESAPIGRRGLYVSMQHVGQDGAILFAGLVGIVLSRTLGHETLEHWGWRIAFLIGAVIVPFGLMLRRSLVETLETDEEDSAAPSTYAGRVPLAAVGLVVLAAGTTVGFLLNYMVTYASTTLQMPPRTAFLATVAAGLAGMIFDPIGGWLSDRFGRKPVMVIPWLLLLVLVMPAFFFLSSTRTALALVGATAVLAAANSTATSAILISICESLPKRSRSGTLGLIYAIAISIFGGSAQLLVAWFTHLTGSPLAPAWYMAIGVAVGLTAMLSLPETQSKPRG